MQCGIGGNLAFEESATRLYGILCCDNVTGIFKVFSLVPNCPSSKCPDVNCRGKDFSPCLSIFLYYVVKFIWQALLLFVTRHRVYGINYSGDRWPTYNHDH